MFSIFKIFKNIPLSSSALGYKLELYTDFTMFREKGQTYIFHIVILFFKKKKHIILIKSLLLLAHHASQYHKDNLSLHHERHQNFGSLN